VNPAGYSGQSHYAETNGSQISGSHTGWPQPESIQEQGAENVQIEIEDSFELIYTAQSQVSSFSSKVQLLPELELSSTQLPPDRVKAFDVQYRMLDPDSPWFISNSISGKFRLGGWKDGYFYYQSNSIHS